MASNLQQTLAANAVIHAVVATPNSTIECERCGFRDRGMRFVLHAGDSLHDKVVCAKCLGQEIVEATRFFTGLLERMVRGDQ